MKSVSLGLLFLSLTISLSSFANESCDLLEARKASVIELTKQYNGNIFNIRLTPRITKDPQMFVFNASFITQKLNDRENRHDQEGMVNIPCLTTVRVNKFDCSTLNYSQDEDPTNCLP